MGLAVKLSNFLQKVIRDSKCTQVQTVNAQTVRQGVVGNEHSRLA